MLCRFFLLICFVLYITPSFQHPWCQIPMSNTAYAGFCTSIFWTVNYTNYQITDREAKQKFEWIRRQAGELQLPELSYNCTKRLTSLLCMSYFPPCYTWDYESSTSLLPCSNSCHNTLTEVCGFPSPATAQVDILGCDNPHFFTSSNSTLPPNYNCCAREDASIAGSGDLCAKVSTGTFEPMPEFNNTATTTDTPGDSAFPTRPPITSPPDSTTHVGLEALGMVVYIVPIVYLGIAGAFFVTVSRVLA